MSVFQDMWPTLRRLGFRKQWSMQNGGEISRQYERHETDGRRTVHVQLESNGRHRASHDVDGGSCIYSMDGSHEVLPTEFTDEAGMIAAIECEATRMDMARWKGAAWWKTTSFSTPEQTS